MLTIETWLVTKQKVPRIFYTSLLPKVKTIIGTFGQQKISFVIYIAYFLESICNAIMIKQYW